MSIGHPEFPGMETAGSHASPCLSLSLAEGLET